MSDLSDFKRGPQNYSQYGVNAMGEVINFQTEKLVKPILRNKGTYLTVQLRSDVDRRYKIFSVAKLVAEAFVECPSEVFNSVIRHNGDPTDCRAENLSWRPRWFAATYNKQQAMKSKMRHFPIRCVQTGRLYTGMWEVAVTHGLLLESIADSLTDGRAVFPQWYKFEFYHRK